MEIIALKIIRIMATTAPDGRHLAWLHYAYTATKNVDEVSVYTSQIDGSRIQEIGHIKVPYEGNHEVSSEEKLRLFKWLPDSKRVRFLYHDTLYVVSTDAGKQ